jgi:hypothetical protein
MTAEIRIFGAGVAWSGAMGVEHARRGSGAQGPGLVRVEPWEGGHPASDSGRGTPVNGP